MSPSDFTYIGSFSVPYAGYGGLGIEFYPEGNGGAGSLFIGLQQYTDFPNTFCEVSIPTPYISPTRLYSDYAVHNAVASVIRREFDPSCGIMPAYVASNPPYSKIVTQALGVVTVPGHGKKLFWAFHGWYAESPIYSIGYSDLDPNPSNPVVSNPRGPWGFSGVNPAKFSNSIWNMPQAWADTYAGGRSIGIGGNALGHLVGETAGGFSAYYFAPWIDDPTNAAPTANSSISYRLAQAKVGWMYPSPSGMVYPAKAVTLGLKPPPDADYPGGYNFFWNPETHGGMRWITTSDGRVGLVGVSSVAGKWSCYLSAEVWCGVVEESFAIQKDGDYQAKSYPWPRQGPNCTHCYFPNSHITPTGDQAGIKGPVAGQYRPAMLFFDPADHAAVLRGSKQSTDVVAYDIRSLWEDLAGPSGKYDWYIDDNGVTKCYDGVYRDQRLYCNAGGGWTLAGAAYDPIARRYYVLQASVARDTAWGVFFPVVHVFQVA